MTSDGTHLRPQTNASPPRWMVGRREKVVGTHIWTFADLATAQADHRLALGELHGSVHPRPRA